MTKKTSTAQALAEIVAGFSIGFLAVLVLKTFGVNYPNLWSIIGL